ncbi:MAG TPA: DNA-protecting protein DprA, partial [Caulobacter sp.]|nr:DNA-protecting protein DprA [Caulobacter sp.]
SGQAHLRERERPYLAEDESADIDHDALRDEVARLLSPTPVSRDELVRATHAPTSAVMAALVELALAERAELLPGGMVAGV